jgi:hypothetical protein
MAEAESQSTRLRRFKAYRDGLMIALLASRPLRLRNLTAETNTKAPIELPWPEMLASYLETYLANHRAGIVALRGCCSGASGAALAVYAWHADDRQRHSHPDRGAHPRKIGPADQSTPIS